MFSEPMRKEDHLFLDLVFPPHIKTYFEEPSGGLKAEVFLSRFFFNSVLMFLNYVHKIEDCTRLPSKNFDL